MSESHLDTQWLKANLRTGGRDDLPQRSFSRRVMVQDISYFSGQKIERQKVAPKTSAPSPIISDFNKPRSTRKPLSSNQLFITQTRSTVLSRDHITRQVLASFITPEKKSKVPKIFNSKFALMSLALSLFIIGLSVSGYGFMQSRLVRVQADTLQNQANKQANQGKSTGGDNSVPSTEKPTAASLSSYRVPADHPRYLSIPKFKVFGAIRQLGTTRSGTLAVPWNIYDAGWYQSSQLPGQKGAMLIDGHVAAWSEPGIFYHLKDLMPGDEVKIETGDGHVYAYSVVKSEFFDANNVDMQSAVRPVNSDKPGLNLITCAGSVIKGTAYELNKRIIVYTELKD